ncbi:syndetin-like isoform X1 [Salvia splendens]|uniref:syndetin-like isoform X1 n=2 Tax=Salvia splendens TaxID=180675 RepID=UPI001C2597DC|nr:syndetin-like isoform X1 [Salvia splendens]
MQPGDNPPTLPFPLSPLLLLNAGDFGEGGFELSRYLFLGSLLFSQESGGMDLSKVGEKIFSSVRSARSIGLPPPPSDRPEVPARAAAAAAVARVLAGLPPHQIHNFSSSDGLSFIDGSRPQDQALDELEKEFYEEEFDPVRHILEQIPSEEKEPAYFEEQAALRLAQLDRISEHLSRHVMEHHEQMVNGMNLVRELEKDLKIANVICMNGRRHLTSSRNEVSRDLIVTECSKKKQVLVGMLPILSELRHAVDLQVALDTCVEEGSFSKAFQILPEYLQLLDSLSNLSAVQEMSLDIEVWLGKTLQKLDSILLEVCQDFKEDGYLTVIDAYALIGDVSGLAEKIQSFFMQEVLSESHSTLKTILQEDFENSNTQITRLTYSDLCTQIPESKFRQCLQAMLAVLFKLMCSYYVITNFKLEDKVPSCHNPSGNQHGILSGVSEDTAKEISSSLAEEGSVTASVQRGSRSSSAEVSLTSVTDAEQTHGPILGDHPTDEGRDDGSAASSSGSPWFLLRKDALTFVSLALQRGCRNLWQLTTSRISVLLSSPAVSSTSIHQFLRNYEDLSIFILAGEAFCGTEAIEFRQKVKSICEGYFAAFHRQNIYALKMVMERENWQILPPDTIQVVSFPGLVGDGAALLVSSVSSPRAQLLHDSKSVGLASGSKKGGFSYWLENGKLFLPKVIGSSEEHFDSFQSNGLATQGSGNTNKIPRQTKSSSEVDTNHVNGTTPEEENEDLHADFIDEDSQLPSRISKRGHSRHNSLSGNNEDSMAQTGSSLSVLRSMDKYARLMQKLEIVNVDFYKGICQLFEIFFYFVFETFCEHNAPASGKGIPHKVKTAIARISQECDQWIKHQPVSTSSSSPTSSSPFTHMDVTPTSPPSHVNHTSFGLKERCSGADTISLVAQLLHRSKTHLQSMLPRKYAALVEDFYFHMVDAVPDLTQLIHRTTAKSLLHINGYADRIANAKWEVKELGMEHNGYVDLLLGEFKHYKTRIAHGGIRQEVQDLLLEYGLENVAETLIEGLSRVKRCTDEGRALMSLDLQVLINGLKHFVTIDVQPKLHIVETFIKAYYLPETEYVHWSRAHPEYSKSQIVGLINLVATMKGWKRKTRLEILEKIE